MDKLNFVYILTNKYNTVLYTGVTNSLKRRVWQHKNKVASGFTGEYNVSKLIWYEMHESIKNAIKREKQIKAGSRQKKLELVNKMNSEWKDLYNELEVQI